MSASIIIKNVEERLVAIKIRPFGATDACQDRLEAWLHKDAPALIERIVASHAVFDKMGPVERIASDKFECTLFMKLK